MKIKAIKHLISVWWCAWVLISGCAYLKVHSDEDKKMEEGEWYIVNPVVDFEKLKLNPGMRWSEAMDFTIPERQWPRTGPYNGVMECDKHLREEIHRIAELEWVEIRYGLLDLLRETRCVRSDWLNEEQKANHERR